jgi:hypothetical protein
MHMWILVLLQHHFGRLDDYGHHVALLQAQFFGAAACDDAIDQILAHADGDVRHDFAEMNFRHSAWQLISCR